MSVAGVIWIVGAAGWRVEGWDGVGWVVRVRDGVCEDRGVGIVMV